MDDARSEVDTAAGRVLYVVACGGPPAAELPGFVERAQARGWDVCVVTTPYGLRFVDADRLAALTGHPVRHDYKRPGQPDVLPPADAFAVTPATFNTVNKMAAGISDTLALGLLNEALGAGLPIVAAPWPNRSLVRHPAFPASLDRLRAWGVRLVFDPSRLPSPGTDGHDGVSFPWDAVLGALPRLPAG